MTTSRVSRILIRTVSVRPAGLVLSTIKEIVQFCSVP